MKQNIVIHGKRCSLNSISRKDIEFCRKLKNANRRVFFFMDIITKKQQAKWYCDYIGKPDECMLVIVKRVLFYNIKIGCIGYRRKEDMIDLYNIMIRPMFSGKGYMADAIGLVVKLTRAEYPCMPVGLFVKRDNYSGYVWYLKNGFVKRGESDTYYLLYHKDTI